MRSNHFRPSAPSVRQVIENTTQLKNLAGVAEYHSSKTLKIANILDKEIAKHLILASEIGNELRLKFDSAIWASKARFLAYPALKQAFPHLISIKFFSDSGQRLATVASKPSRKPLSAQTQQLLLETADLLEDPALKDALARLARSG